MVASRFSRAVWIALLAILSLGFLCAPTRAELPTSGVGATIEAIDAAVASGELSPAEGMLNKVRFVTGSATLPARFQFDDADRIKCGTGIVLDAVGKLAEASPGIRAEIQALVARPVTTAHIDSPHFRIHYDTSGPNQIHGWPDTGYRDAVAAACERAWNFYHLDNAWQVPPTGSEGTRDSLIDCYVTDAGGAYGWTAPDVKAGPRPDGWTAFFVIDHAYDPPFGYADRALPMQITVAHEYHHVVQMGYTLANSWWMENVATFMEDEVYDAIDDNHAYIFGYMNAPHLELSTSNGSHEYGAFIWPTMIKERWSHDVVRQVYDCTASGESVYRCFDAAFAPLQTSFASMLAEWGVWNFYTSVRDDGRHYREGRFYEPAMAFDQQFNTYPQLGRHPSVARRPEATGQSVMRLARNPSSSDRKLTITFDGPSCTRQVVVIAKEAGQLVFHESYLALDAAGNGSVGVSNWNNMEYAYLIVQMSPDCPAAQDYTFDAVTTAATAVDDPPLYTRTVRLDQNEPNPFGPETRIRYALAQSSPVHLSVFDAAGRQVRLLAHTGQAAGEYQIRWDGRDDAGDRVPPGVYFYRLQADGQTAVNKMVLMD